MKLSIIVIFLLLISSFSYSQKEDYNWILQNQLMLNFNSSPPKVSIIPNNLGHRSNITAISDRYGQLLMYGDAKYIYDNHHNLLNNPIDSLSNFYNTSLIQLNEKLYFFSVKAKYNSGGCPIDTYLFTDTFNKTNNLHNGTEILANGCFQIQFFILRHANYSDFWLVTLSENKTDFQAYLVSKSGISKTAVVSEFNKELPINQFSKISISPTFDKIIFTTNNFLHTIDFNSLTGIFSNYRTIYLPKATFSELSPDGSKLYTSDLQTGILKQYNTALIYDSILFKKSSQTVLSNNNTPIRDMQSAPDGKLYCTIRNYEYLSYIENPNLKYPGCRFVRNGLYLEGQKCPYTLPNIINYRPIIDFQTAPCSYIVKFKYLGTTPKSTFWHFGNNSTSTELSPTHIYETAGKYTVSVEITYTDDTTETINKEIEIYEKPEKLKIMYSE